MADRTRSRWVKRIERGIVWPRLQVSLMLMLTALCVFATSVVLLAVEVDSMAVRYPMSIAAGYVVFLILLGIWLRLKKMDVDIPVDLALPVDLGSGSGALPQAFEFGGGGDFAGAGAGGSWDTSARGFASVAEPSGGGPSAGGVSVGGSGGFSLDLDLDELWIVALAVVVAIGGLLAIFYVVYAAPLLLAEITVDSMVAAGLYRSIKNAERRHWLSTAIRKTAMPAILAMVLFGVCGYLLQAVEPEARTIGEVVRGLGD